MLFFFFFFNIMIMHSNYQIVVGIIVFAIVYGYIRIYVTHLSMIRTIAASLIISGLSMFLFSYFNSPNDYGTESSNIFEKLSSACYFNNDIYYSINGNEVRFPEDEIFIGIVK